MTTIKDMDVSYPSKKAGEIFPPHSIVKQCTKKSGETIVPGHFVAITATGEIEAIKADGSNWKALYGIVYNPNAYSPAYFDELNQVDIIIKGMSTVKVDADVIEGQWLKQDGSNANVVGQSADVSFARFISSAKSGQIATFIFV